MSNSPFLSFIWRRSSFDFLVQPQNALLLPFSDDEIERGTPKNFIYDNIWLHMFIYLAFGIFCLGNRKLNTAALNLIEWFHGSIDKDICARCKSETQLWVSYSLWYPKYLLIVETIISYCKHLLELNRNNLNHTHLKKINITF